MSNTIMPIVESIMLTISEDEKSRTVVHAVQSDNLSRIIRTGFYDKDAQYVLDPDAKVEFVVKKPGTAYRKKSCTVDSSGDYVEVTLDEEILSVPGNVRANFLIWDSDKEQSIRSQEFTLHVGEKLDKDEDAPITSDIPLAVQVRQNTADIADLKKNGVGGDCPTKEELSDIVDQYFRENPVTGATPEMISTAVESYLAEHHVQGDSYDHSNIEIALQGINGAPVTTITTGTTSRLATTKAVVDYVSSYVASHTLQGKKGEKGDKGDSYTITQSDYTAIANVVLGLIPNGNEVLYGN